jgi:hypothetical protein
MENKPKKSKAGIITFIVVVILLVLGYLLFSRSRNQTATQGTSSTNSQAFNSLSISQRVGNVVSSLFGGNKATPSTQTTSTQTNTTATTPTNTTTSTTNIGTGQPLGGGTLATTGDNLTTTPSDNTSGIGTSSSGIGGTTNTAYSPLFNPIPTPDISTLPTTTTDLGSSSSSTITATTQPSTVANSCPDDPLVFTGAEQAKLSDLLTQFYLIAPNLKSSADVATVTNDVTSDQTLLTQANELTAECTSEKADPLYTGPQVLKDNPYYSNPATSSDSYLPGQTSGWIQNNQLPAPSVGAITSWSDFEKILNIW